MQMKVQIKWLWLIGLFVLLLLAGTISAQETDPGSVLFVTKTDSTGAPVVELHAYGIDGQGESISLSPQTVTISHGGVVVPDWTIAGESSAGTFTIFIIDIPPGVSDQLDDIGNVINEFATPANMQEQLDYVAIYQVGATDVVERVAPTTFHNGIRNLFADPLNPEVGPTALLDSVGNLLDDIETIKPNPELATSIVLMTDGTDAVSTQFTQDQAIDSAIAKSVPIHTIHLSNLDLGGAEFGRDSLQQLSQGSRGTSVVMAESGSQGGIWRRINAFRTRTILRYTIPQLQAGVQPVIVSLIGDQNATAVTSVEVAGNAPSVIFELTPEERVFTLASLDEPIKLRLNTDVTWLDGTERTLAQAQLYVNDLLAHEIPPDSLGEFEAEISQFQYGQNDLQIVIVDEQGIRGSSPKITVSVAEGDKTIIPESLQTGFGISRTVLFPLLCLGLLVLLGGSVWLLSRRGLINIDRSMNLVRGVLNPPRKRSRKAEVVEDAGISPISPPAYQEPLPTTAYLEPVESISRMPQYLQLQPGETRLGRSPAQSDIAFENDVTVSRLHAVIIFTEGEYRLYDEGSTSGTLLNGQTIVDYGAPLIDGDEIQMGAVRVRFRQV